jgi:hypothetical protein
LPIIFHHEKTMLHLSPSFFCRGQTSRLAPDSLRWFDPRGEEMFVYIYICINVYMSYCFANIACLVMILLIYQHSHGTCPIYGWFSH